MGKTQPTYTKEFKQQAVQLFETSGKSKTQIARDLGISDSALNKWCKELSEHGEEAFPGKGHQTSIEEENRKLKREMALLSRRPGAGLIHHSDRGSGYASSSYQLLLLYFPSSIAPSVLSESL